MNKRIMGLIFIFIVFICSGCFNEEKPKNEIEEPVITLKDINDATSSTIANQKYTGKEIKPIITLTMDNEVLILDTDYTLSYENNINVGTATVIITGTGNYTGTKETNFKIVESSSKPKAIITCINKIYNGSIQTIATCSGGTISNAEQTKAGTYKITCKGDSTHSNAASQKCTINQLNLSSATISTIANQKYTGKEVTPELTVTLNKEILTKNVDYSLSYKNNINIGTAKVIITGKENYTGETEATFKIVETSAPKTQAIITCLNKEYNGSTQVIASCTGGTISNASKSAVGSYTVTCKGDSTHTDATSKLCSITAADISTATVSAIADQKYTGNQIIPSPTVKVGTRTLVKDTDYSLSYSNNIKIGTASITIAGKSNYKGTKVVTFKIVESSEKTEEKIHFIKVAESDATLIESNGKYGLIDASNPSNSKYSYLNIANGNGTMVLNYLKKIGVKHLEFIIASHAHSDHIGGISELVKNSSLVDSNTTFIYKQVTRDDSKYGEIVIQKGNIYSDISQDWKSYEFLEEAKSVMSSKGATLLETISHSSTSMKKLNASYVKNSDKWMDYITFKMGDLTFKIYNLYEYKQTYNGKKYIDLNSNSLVTIITSSTGKKAWLSGDLNVRAEYEKYYADRLGKVDIFKANHHGYIMSNSYSLLSKIKPSYMVIPNYNDKGDAAFAYVNGYGGKVYHAVKDGYDGVVITIGSSITVSQSPTTFNIANKWLEWNDNNEKVYWIYINGNKKMVISDWVQSGSEWYYLNEKGLMLEEEWLSYKGKWYYLGPNGVMYRNTTKTINGKSYHFNSDGACDSSGC